MIQKKSSVQIRNKNINFKANCNKKRTFSVQAIFITERFKSILIQKNKKPEKVYCKYCKKLQAKIIRPRCSFKHRQTQKSEKKSKRIKFFHGNSFAGSETLWTFFYNFQKYKL